MNNRMYTLDVIYEPGDYEWQGEETVTEEQTRTEDVGAGAGETVIVDKLTENTSADNVPFLAAIAVSVVVIAAVVALSVRKIAAKAAVSSEDR